MFLSFYKGVKPVAETDEIIMCWNLYLNVLYILFW